MSHFSIVFIFLLVPVLTSSQIHDHVILLMNLRLQVGTEMFVIESCIVCYKGSDCGGGEATPIIHFTLHPGELLSLARVHKPKVNLFISSVLLLDWVAEHLGNC